VTFFRKAERANSSQGRQSRLRAPPCADLGDDLRQPFHHPLSEAADRFCKAAVGVHKVADGLRKAADRLHKVADRGHKAAVWVRKAAVGVRKAAVEVRKAAEKVPKAAAAISMGLFVRLEFVFGEVVISIPPRTERA